MAPSLTPAVCVEALASPTAVIISYHPPIFKPLTSFTLANPLQSSLLKCAAHGISIYSPHTALDSIWGGVNDWLAEGVLGGHGTSHEGQVHPLAEQTPGQTDGGEGRLVTLQEPIDMKELEKRVSNHLRIPQSVLFLASDPIRAFFVDGSYCSPCVGCSSGRIRLSSDARHSHGGCMRRFGWFAAARASSRRLSHWRDVPRTYLLTQRIC